jgi:outer membrane lipoprotein-sorting protein
MKRVASIAITLSLLLTLLAGANENARAGTAPQLLSGILQKMENAHRNLKSLKAVIVQQRVNTQIGSSDTDYGTMIYKPAANGKIRLRLDYTRPDSRIAALDRDSYIYYQPRINQAFKGALSKASKGKNGLSGLLAGFNGSARSLTANYNVEYVREELINGRTTTQLHLTPKEKSSIASIEIWVSHDTWLPVQTKTVERNGDYTIFKMDKLELNARVEDSAFSVRLPSGTAIVDKL